MSQEIMKYRKDNYITDMNYKICTLEFLERIANALEKIAEDNKPWQKITLDAEGYRCER
jgi:hypothetical protein